MRTLYMWVGSLGQRLIGGAERGAALRFFFSNAWDRGYYVPRKSWGDRGLGTRVTVQPYLWCNSHPSDGGRDVALVLARAWYDVLTFMPKPSGIPLGTSLDPFGDLRRSV